MTNPSHYYAPRRAVDHVNQPAPSRRATFTERYGEVIAAALGLVAFGFAAGLVVFGLIADMLFV